MTDQEMRIAIAEACGKLNDYTRQALVDFKGRDGYPDAILQLARVPDYPSDLNAMHEAEKVLNEKQQVWYLQKLTQVRYKDGIGGMIACMIDKTTFATARQRAEAFLRTIGKWRDG